MSVRTCNGTLRSSAPPAAPTLAIVLDFVSREENTIDMSTSWTPAGDQNLALLARVDDGAWTPIDGAVATPSPYGFSPLMTDYAAPASTMRFKTVLYIGDVFAPIAESNIIGPYTVE